MKFTLTKDQLTRLYNAGYEHGHHDTVESNAIHILEQDKTEIHQELALEFVVLELRLNPEE